MSVNRYAMVAAQMGEPIKIERRIFIGEELYVLASDYDALTARVAELEKDAARYRWLRVQNGGKPIVLVAENFGGSLDAAIDYEMQQPTADGGGAT